MQTFLIFFFRFGECYFKLNTGRERAIDMLINVSSIPSLHLAIARGDESTATRLIDNRADVNEQTNYGATPLFIAGNSF